MIIYKHVTQVSLEERYKNMSLPLTGQGCHTTFPLINLKNFGSAKSIKETWVKTDDHVALANTRCTAAGKKQLNTRYAVHLDMSREITTIFAELVPTVSREYDFYVNYRLSTRYCPEMWGRV